MADKSTIEWTDSTWNPIVGCSIVSPGCTNCYAMKQADRIRRMNGDASPYFGTTKTVNGKPVWTGVVKWNSDEARTAPLRWTRPRMIFVNSMSDLFHESVPDEWIDQVFATMALASQHTFQLLSKRSARMRAYCSSPKTVERIAALVYDAQYEQGTDHHLSRGVWRTGNRRRGSDLASQKAPWETEAEGGERISEGGRPDRLSAGQGGISEPGRLPLDYDNDRRRENSDRSASGHLDEQQRANPVQTDDQSQEWDQRRQPLREFGTSDAIRTKTPRDRSLERQSQSAKGEQASEDAAHGSGRFADAPDARDRRYGKDDRRSLRDEPESGLGDLHRKDLVAHLVWPLPNVWLGVSAEDQTRYDERKDDLRATPATVHFFSFEPLLGPIAADYLGEWAIVGGESQDGARPMHPAWARSIRDQCASAGAAYFFKQWGDWAPTTFPPIGSGIAANEVCLHLDGRHNGDGGIREGGIVMRRVGKRRAGRLLDGVEHNAMPKAAP